MKNFILGVLVLLFFGCSEQNTLINSKNALANTIEYQDKINKAVYYESDAYKMILFAMKSNQTLKPHTAEMNTPLLVLEGKAKITIDGKQHILKAGESIILPKNINHGVYPITDIKFVLIK